MTDTFEWQGRVGDAWAEQWRRTDRTLAPLNDALGARALRLQPATVLDVGCGAGATSLALADVLPEAAITGIDLSEALIAVARERAKGRAALRFDAGDAASWRPASGAFDLIVSRHGVMFFDDAAAAFTHLRSLLAPDGRLVFSCFRGRWENDWMAALRPVLARFAPDMVEAPEASVGPFAFGEPARVESILIEAGFAAPAIEPLDFDFVAGAGEDPVADAVAYFSRIGPVARLLSELDTEQRLRAIGEVGAIAAARLADGRVAFRAAAWIVSAAALEECS
jgi:SAM-dependent methyltransferase